MSLWKHRGLLALVALVACGGIAHAQDKEAENIRGASTGPTTAPGFDHPWDTIHLKDAKPADNMYPVLQRPEQDKAAAEKLAALAQKTGKKPNIFIFLMDDTGFSDPGFTGGGVVVGNATPSMDKFANEGLFMSSAYSTPSCSPTRATIHTAESVAPRHPAPADVWGSRWSRRCHHHAYVAQGAGLLHPRRGQMAYG